MFTGILSWHAAVGALYSAAIVRHHSSDSHSLWYVIYYQGRDSLSVAFCVPTRLEYSPLPFPVSLQTGTELWLVRQGMLANFSSSSQQTAKTTLPETATTDHMLHFCYGGGGGGLPEAAASTGGTFVRT